MNINRRDFIMGAGLTAASAALARPIRSCISGRRVEEEQINLPYDAQVEFLESTGTQVCDTFYIPTITDVLEFPPNSPNVVGGSIDGCISNGAPYRRLHGFNRTAQVYVGATNYTLGGASWNYNEFWTIDFPAQKLWFGNISANVSVSAETLPVCSFCFMARHNAISTPTYDNYKSGSRFRWFRVSCGGIMIHDYISVRFTTEYGETEGAMYDRVSGQLFRNQGTGAFIIGPDVG